MKRIFSMVLCLCLLLAALPVSAKSAADAAPQSKGRILFVPHDNRPISDQQTADTVRKLGYDVVVPPADLLGSREHLGNPDALWDWVEKNTDKNLKAAVLSADSLLYGSLVGSRKHTYSRGEVLSRVARFAAYNQKNPKLKTYVFASIMRTPRTGEASGTEEPSYYQSYGADIFRYTALTDKAETDGLLPREKKEYAFLQELIPEEAIKDWLNRRNKNFAASEALIDLTRQKVFDYCVLGRDDNAPHSQTHMESRHLAKYGSDLSISQFQAMAGTDELGMLMLTRAVNDLEAVVPFVYVRYNWGAGPRTVPSYSDETIEKSMRSHIVAAGGLQVSSPKRANLVLLVNTNPSGRTYEANYPQNNGVPREGTKYFVDMVAEAVAMNEPVGIGDIAFANGADNALMEQLKKRGLLFKLRAYSGWNTATNSTGFVLGQGMLSGRMTDAAVDELLLTRYLDDWAYQANVRQTVAHQIGWFRGSGFYASLNEKRAPIERRATSLMQRFVDDNLPPFDSLRAVTVTFPWNRMFEASVEPAAN